mgnify:CR=1 FL=1
MDTNHRVPVMTTHDQEKANAEGYAQLDQQLKERRQKLLDKQIDFKEKFLPIFNYNVYIVLLSLKYKQNWKQDIYDNFKLIYHTNIKLMFPNYEIPEDIGIYKELDLYKPNGYFREQILPKIINFFKIINEVVNERNLTKTLETLKTIENYEILIEKLSNESSSFVDHVIYKIAYQTYSSQSK